MGRLFSDAAPIESKDHVGPTHGKGSVPRKALRIAEVLASLQLVDF
jgi:hypothetical protein